MTATRQSLLPTRSDLTRNPTRDITPIARRVTPPRPPSDRNGGRFQIGMGGRLQIGIPGRLHRNPHARPPAGVGSRGYGASHGTEPAGYPSPSWRPWQTQAQGSRWHRPAGFVPFVARGDLLACVPTGHGRYAEIAAQGAEGAWAYPRHEFARSPSSVRRPPELRFDREDCSPRQDENVALVVECPRLEFG